MQTEIQIQTYSSINNDYSRVRNGSATFSVQLNDPFRINCTTNPTTFLQVGQFFTFNQSDNLNVRFEVKEVYSTYFIVDKRVIFPNEVNQQLVFQSPSLIQTVGADFPIFTSGTTIYIYGTSGGTNDDAYSITAQSDDSYYLIVSPNVVNENPSPVDTFWSVEKIDGTFTYTIEQYVPVLKEKYERLDLFEDETISLTLKQVDTTDISKNYADFTQTFNVPASDKNNIIFSQYYDVDNQFQFNANKKVPAKLNINTIPFRYGKIQLEEVILKNGKPDRYKITFYTNLVKLKDLFGDDTLNSLLYELDNEIPLEEASDLDIDYTSERMYISVNGGDYRTDIITPLISTKRIWEYGTGSDDIKYTSGNTSKTIKYDELLPSVKLIRLIELIKKRYKINFSDDFFNDKREEIFNKLYMWCNKKLVPEINGDYLIPTEVYRNSVSSTIFTGITTNSDGLFSVDFSNLTGFVAPYITSKVRLKTTSGTAKCKILLYDANKNKVFETTETTISTSYSNIIVRIADLSYTSQFYMVIKTDVYCNILYDISFLIGDSSFVEYISIDNSKEITPKLSILTSLPTMKIYDFIISLIKTFNLVILPQPFKENDFIVKTLDSYLEDGNELDLTEYISKEQVTIGRNQVYNNIKYALEENTYILNNNYFLSNSKQFGSDSLKNILRDTVGNGDYTVESKFWLMKNVNLGSYPIAIGIDKDSKFIENKPVLLCYGGHIPANVDKFGFLVNGISDSIERYPYMGTDDSYSTIQYNKSDFITDILDYVVCSLNKNPTGGTENGVIYFETYETVGATINVGDIINLEGNYFKVNSKTTVSGRVKLIGDNIDNDWVITSTFNRLDFESHRYIRYGSPDYSKWLTSSYPYKDSITFGSEYDYNGVLRNKTLYKNYYEQFLTQLYSVNTRTWSFTGYLPDNLLYYLNLSSTIKIGDKRFMINDMTIDLLTGKITLKMINYTSFKLGSKVSSGDRTDVLNNLVKYGIYPSTRGIVFFNGTTKTIYNIIEGSNTQSNGEAGQNQYTYYIGNDIDSFILNFTDTPGNQNVTIYLVRYGQIIEKIDSVISSTTDDLSINLGSKGKSGLIGDIIMIIPR